MALWDMDVIAGDPVNPENAFRWSPEFRAMLGFTDEPDFPDKLDSWASRLHPEDKEQTLDAFAAHLTDHSGRTPYDIQYRLALKDGSFRWFQATGETLRNPQGVPLRVVGGLRDIQDDKLTEARLQADGDQLRRASAALLGIGEQLQSSTVQAVDASASSVETMNGLQAGFNQIEAVVNLIASVADRTNLLALNASIEAARAGEAGRGFEVVAKEVGELAAQTASSTKDISERVASSNGDVRRAIEAAADIQRVVGTIEVSQRAIADLLGELDGARGTAAAHA